MAGDQVDQVKNKVDLVEVISSYIPLKKAGRNFSGLCPFHAEKTPSFMISPERQAWKCFGCSEAGDVFTFLEKMEGWDFKETLSELAKRVGVKLSQNKPSKGSQQKEKLVEINELVWRFYSHILNKHPLGESARLYLQKRGIKSEIWDKFRLGFAPGGWDNTLNFLIKRGYLLSDLAICGLVIARSQGTRSGYYDRFRNRLMFPLSDSKGTILGFSGRVINEDGKAAKEAKYINSPETPIFNKGSLLFGLDVAKASIREKNEAVLVEGEFDVISSHMAGVTNAVASKGTALTERQVTVISRLCENVVLCFDRDLAGDAAARRGIELMDFAGLNIKVARLGAKYKDPDEFAQADPDGYKSAIESGSNIYDYFIESASSRFDSVTSLGKKKIGQEIIPVISKISDDILRAHYITKLAKVLDLDTGLVAEAVEKKVINFSDSVTAGSKPQNKSLEEYFLALFLLQDEVVGKLVYELDPSDFEDNSAKSFWKWIHDIMKTSDLKAHKSLKKLLFALPSELNSFVDNLFLLNINPSFSDKEIGLLELTKVARRIKQLSFKRQLLQISDKIKTAERGGDLKKIDILAREFAEVSKNLKNIVIP